MRITKPCHFRLSRFYFGKAAIKIPSPKYELSQSLYKLAFKEKFAESNATKDKRLNIPNGRINLVSPDLCDDTLNLLSPSLEKYKGCELVDLNPLGGLWSSKLYELLQPSRYRVVQGNEESRYYKAFTKTLLKRKNAVAHFFDPVHTREGPMSPLAAQVNYAELDVLRSVWETTNADTLVISANLGQTLQRTRNQGDSFKSHIPSRAIIRQLNDTLQRDGSPLKHKKVRLLLWTNEIEMRLYLPSLLSDWRIMPAELSHDYRITQIARSGPQLFHAHRPSYMAAQSAIWTAQRMLQSGIVHAPHRREAMHSEIWRQLEEVQRLNTASSPSAGLPVPPLQHEIDEMVALLQAHYRGEMVTRRKKAWDGSTRSGITPEWQRLLDIKDMLTNLTLQPADNNIGHRNDRIRNSSVFFALREHELAVEAAQSTGQDASASQPAIAAIVQTIKMTDAQFSSQRKFFWEGKRSRVDNHHALYRDNPLLPWDRRPFEPLHTTPDEFWPQVPLTLLDFELKDGALERPNIYSNPFVRALFTGRQATVTQTLDHVAMGSAAALLPLCPSVMSPKAGGSLFPEYMNPALLTTEMLQELAAAWEGYAFKLSDNDLRRSDPSGVIWDVDDEENMKRDEVKSAGN